MRRGQKRAGVWGVAAVLGAAACGGATDKGQLGGEGGGGHAGSSVVSSGGKASGGPSKGGGSVAEGGAPDSGHGGVAGSAGVPAGSGGSGGGSAGTLSECDAPCCDTSLCIGELTGKNSDYGVYPWKSSWFLTGCQDRVGPYCVPVVESECPTEGVSTVETFQLGGDPGQNYKVTFTFNGLVEAKQYEGGQRDQGNVVPANVDSAISDTFYRDGHPVDSGHNVWKLAVYDEKGALARHYFLNSMPADAGYENDRTFLVSYTKSIVVVGGGKITYTVEDPDCRSVDNCGPGVVPADVCANPRTIPNEANAMLPAMYKDAADGQIKPTVELNSFSNNSTAQPWHSQAGHFTITAGEATADPVIMNYP